MFQQQRWLIRPTDRRAGSTAKRVSSEGKSRSTVTDDRTRKVAFGRRLNSVHVIEVPGESTLLHPTPPFESRVRLGEIGQPVIEWLKIDILVFHG
jgi:hypothetical protein